MRRLLFRVYLIIYFALIGGAGVALKQSGALQHVPVRFTIVAAMLAVGLGVLAALTRRREP
jgi:hypothetical protein